MSATGGLSARSLRVVFATVAVALVLSGCAAARESTSGVSTRGSSPADLRDGAISETASGLRSGFDDLWLERSFLDARLVTFSLAGSRQVIDATNEGLAQNSASLAALFVPGLGQNRANAFESLFARRDRLIVDLADALASGDGGRVDVARSALDDDARSLADAVSMNNNQVGRHVPRSLLEGESRHLVALSDASKKGDLSGRGQALTALLGGAVEIGDVLARGFDLKYPDLYRGSSESQAASVRQAFGVSYASQVLLQASEFQAPRDPAASTATRRTTSQGGAAEDTTVADAARGGGRALLASLDFSGASLTSEATREIERLWGEQARLAGLISVAEVGGDSAVADSAYSDLLETLDRVVAVAGSVSPELDQTSLRRSLHDGARSWRDSALSWSAGDFGASYAALDRFVDAIGATATLLVPVSADGSV